MPKRKRKTFTVPSPAERERKTQIGVISPSVSAQGRRSTFARLRCPKAAAGDKSPLRLFDRGASSPSLFPPQAAVGLVTPQREARRAIDNRPYGNPSGACGDSCLACGLGQKRGSDSPPDCHSLPRFSLGYLAQGSPIIVIKECHSSFIYFAK